MQPRARIRHSGAILMLLLCGSMPSGSGPALAAAVFPDPARSDSVASAKEAELTQLPQARSTAASPDSIRVELAAAYRARGDLESRLRALALLEALPPSSRQTADYWRELARTRAACSRHDLACQAWEEVLAREPGAANAHLAIAHLARVRLLRYQDEQYLTQALAHLDTLLAVQPHHPEALALQATLLYHQAASGDCRGTGPPVEAVHRAALEATRTLIALDPDDPGARLLYAIHLLALGAAGEAELSFRQAITLMPARERAVFVEPPGGEARTTSNPRPRPGHADSVTIDPWLALDPTPLLPPNEAQLEYWKRLTLANLLFGATAAEGARGQASAEPGWATDLGRVFVRYGPPHDRQLEPASLGGGDATYAKYSPRLYDRRHDQDTRFPREMPALHWTYQIRGEPQRFSFRDETLSGRFSALSPTRQSLAALDRTTPYALTVADAATTAPVYLNAASFAGSGRHSRAATVLGLERRLALEANAERSERMTLILELLDAGGHRQQTLHVPLRAEQCCRLTDELELWIAARDLVLAPGEYTLLGRIAAGSRATEGHFVLPLSVRDLRTTELAISDLELLRPLGDAASRTPPGLAITRAARAWIPLPVAVCGAERELSVSYEIYNLAYAAGSGRRRFQLRYTVLPRSYAMAHASRAALGLAAVGDSLYFGGLGQHLDGTRLTAHNYADVAFPIETAEHSAGAHLPRVARLPLAGLAPGAYELLVTVHDHVSGARAAARTALTLTEPPPAQPFSSQ